MNSLSAMAGVMADNALSVRVQKTALEQRSTGFRILLDAPDAIYHPGDVVKGFIELELSKSISAREIRVRLCGSMQCFIRRNYCCSDTIELFAQEMVVWSAARAAVSNAPGSSSSAVGQGGGARGPSSAIQGHEPPSSARSSTSGSHRANVPTVSVTMPILSSHPSSTLAAESSEEVNEDSVEADMLSRGGRPRSNSTSNLVGSRGDYLSRLKIGTLLRNLGLTPPNSGASGSNSAAGHSLQRPGSAEPSSLTANNAANEEGRLSTSSLSNQPQHRRLRSFGSMDEPNQLGKGLHRFPFQFVLPTPNDVLTDMPSTFYESLTFVRYELIASYTQPWPKPRRHVSRDLTVQSRVPVNRRRLEQTAQGENAMEIVVGGFWTRMGRAPKGLVSCKVSLPRTGFLLGDELPININVKHFCELQQSEGVLVELRRRQTVNMGTNTERISRTISYRIEALNIDPETLSSNLTLTLPTDAMEPPSTVRRDAPIHLAYYVMVSIFPRRGCHDTRITVRVPIVMANYRRPTPVIAQYDRDANGNEYRHRARMSMGEPLPLYTRVADQASMMENMANDVLSPPPSYDLIALAPSVLNQVPASPISLPRSPTLSFAACLGQSMEHIGDANNGEGSANNNNNNGDGDGDDDDIMEEVQMDTDDTDQLDEEESSVDSDSDADTNASDNNDRITVERNLIETDTSAVISAMSTVKLDDVSEMTTSSDIAHSNNVE